MITYDYIDASNLFYGGRKSLGWSIDYEKLIKYLQRRFGVSKVYYFGGIEICGFPFDSLRDETVCLVDLEKYLTGYIMKNKSPFSSEMLKHHIGRVHFYQKLESFGYKLILKPVKTYIDENGKKKQKANCDAELVLYLMRDKLIFDCAVVLSGDGDFLAVLKYLRNNDKKEVIVLAHGSRTASDIKRFAGDRFIDFINLRDFVEHIVLRK